MNNDFDEKLKQIERELLDIKTASVYSSVKSANFTTSFSVYTGVYQINYEGSNEQVLSNIYCGTSQGEWGIAYIRTPEINSQIVEVVADDPVPLSIASNKKVVSVVRL